MAAPGSLGLLQVPPFTAAKCQSVPNRSATRRAPRALFGIRASAADAATKDAVLKAFLEKRALKIISGLQNFDRGSVASVITAADKVFLPLADGWYKGSITGYNEATKKHSVKYDDGEAEELTLADERIKFSTSSEEIKCLNLKFGISNLDKKGYDELLALAVSFHDYQGYMHEPSRTRPERST